MGKEIPVFSTTKTDEAGEEVIYCRVFCQRYVLRAGANEKNHRRCAYYLIFLNPKVRCPSSRKWTQRPWMTGVGYRLP